jgi:hypothetical protein
MQQWEETGSSASSQAVPPAPAQAAGLVRPTATPPRPARRRDPRSWRVENRTPDQWGHSESAAESGAGRCSGSLSHTFKLPSRCPAGRHAAGGRSGPVAGDSDPGPQSPPDSENTRTVTLGLTARPQASFKFALILVETLVNPGCRGHCRMPPSDSLPH